MFESVAGRRVVVTGASRGIGLGIARTFVQAGADVVVNSSTGKGLDDVAAELASVGRGKVVGVVADTSTPDGCRELVREAATALGGLDTVCANAGVFPEVPLEELTPDELHRVFSINVYAGFYLTQSALPHLRESGRGRIILTSSITGPITGYPGWCHYGASKAAQLGFMRTAAIEFARDGITVNAVLPGNVLTEGLEHLGEDYLKSMAATVPTGSLGTVGDIGHAAVFLASDEAAFVNGHALVIDGGQILPETADCLQP